MNRFSKRINPLCRPEIDRLKFNIKHSTGYFDGDGYIFKTAISELRKEGFRIVYNREKCMYMKSYAHF
jgi:hypothetical protein